MALSRRNNMFVKRMIGLPLAAFIFVTMTTAITAQVRAYRVSDRQVQSLLDRLENRTDTFKAEVDRALDRSPVDGTSREDFLNNMVANFETATDRLNTNFSDRRSTSADVEEVLTRAVRINTFMRNNRLTRTAQNEWNLIRTDLDTLAGYYRVTANWEVAQTFPGGGPRQNERQVRTVLNRLSTRNASFRQSFDRWSRMRRNSDMSRQLDEYERAVEALDRDYTNRNSASDRVQEVLRASAPINEYILSERPSSDVSSKWGLVRDDLNALAGHYRVSWDWNSPVTPGGGSYGSFDSRLTGTYQLNSSLSDNVTTAVDRAILNANYNADRRDRVRRNLERRLSSPSTLTIEKRGQDVTMSSANTGSIVLTADGVKRTETSPNGRSVSTSITTTSRDLTINYEGDRMNDYHVTFTPLNDDQLRVTRRVYLENQNETVTVTSVYDKTSRTPQWTADNTGYPAGGKNGFIVPNNTNIIATLDTPLSTRTARDGGRFTMTVTSPSEYRGATIEGNVIGERSGVVSGRANMSLSFDTIRMRDGRTYSFAGIVNSVRQTDGDVVSVNNEGAIRDNSQTTKTVTRAGIGAALGALIGAIAGGGQGAAIGAGVGAGAGAGTVVLQGRDNLELETGSEFSITATAPAGVR